MLTITRRQALHLRSVLRRAFGQVRVGPDVCFIAGAEGLTVRSIGTDAAIELRVPGARAAETIHLPFSALADFEGKKDDQVELTATDNGHATAQWREGNSPQLVEYDAVKLPASDNFPTPPTDFVTNPPGLMQALHEASEVADQEQGTPRHATHCLQLTPDGTIHATDGHQALMQSGFVFPWKQPLLVPRNRVFHSPELPHDKPVSVAQNGDWLVLSVDSWTIYLRVSKDGRFPDMAEIVPNPANATARCQLSEDDGKFLVEILPKLPCGDESDQPVTMELNGHVVVRAKATDDAKPTEVLLSNSHCSGKPICICTNRVYLRRAMKLGIRELCLYGDKVALSGETESRKFVWMPLEPGSVIKSVAESIRIESPKAAGVSPTPLPQKPKAERKPKPVNETTPNTNGKAATNGQAKSESTNGKPTRRKAGRQDLAALIEQAIKLRSALHEKTHEAGELVKGLKQHRRANRAIQNTLSSIRQLKGLGV